MGSAECSHHEFEDTRLGSRRPGGSLLYVTEVAVCPDARGRGIGSKLMQVSSFAREVRTEKIRVESEEEGSL